MGGVTCPNTSLLPRSAAALGLFEGLISRTLVKRFTAKRFSAFCAKLVTCNQKQFSDQLPPVKHLHSMTCCLRCPEGSHLDRFNNSTKRLLCTQSQKYFRCITLILLIVRINAFGVQ